MSLESIQVGSRLFMTAAPDFEPGTILTPGFGQRMGAWGLNTNDGLDAAWAGSALLEMSWEVVRLREFPERPSRLDCLFLWEDMERAKDFYSRRPWPSHLYEVEVSECSRVFIANMDLISYFKTPETTASLMERARRYWKGDETPVPEVLLEGSVRIVKTLSHDRT